MFKLEFLHELSYWLRKWETYFYLLVFMGFGFLIYAGSLGLFDPVPVHEEMRRHLNSFSGINDTLLSYHKLLFVLLPIFVGGSLYKDYKGNAHSIIYSFPILKKDYLLGRLTAGFLLLLIVSFLVMGTFIFAEHLPGLNPNLLGEFSMGAYLQVFLVYLFPNWLILAMITFAVVMMTRNIYAAFGVVIVPTIIQLITENAFAGNGYLIALFDPIGQNTSAFIQKDWDIQSKNELALPISSLVIYNRALWLFLSGLFFLYAYRSFGFVERLERSFPWAIKQKSESEAPRILEKSARMVAAKTYDFGAKLQVIWAGVRIGLLKIIKSPIFWVLTALGITGVVFTIIRVSTSEEFVLVPATQFIVGLPFIPYSMIVVLSTFIFSGLIIHRERQSQMHELVAISPFSNSVFLFSKLLSLMSMQFIMLCLFIIAGMIVQVSLGYYQFDLGLYFFCVFIQAWIPLITWIFASVFVHTIFRNLYLGIFLLFIGWIGTQGISNLGFDTRLIEFNLLPNISHSIFNGMGTQGESYFTLAFYSFFIGCVLLWFGSLFYQRELVSSFREFWAIGQKRISFKSVSYLIIAMVGFTFSGIKIYEAEQEIGFANLDREKVMKDFTADFAQYDGLTSPKIVSIKASIDLLPENRSFVAKGQYTLVNKSDEVIDKLIIKTGFDEQTELSLEAPNSILLENKGLKVFLFQLDEGLAVGDSTTLNFKIKSTDNTLFERNSPVLSNGTFLRSDIFPRLGYNFSNELPDPQSPGVEKRNYQAIDSDLVDLEFTISTSPDQIAIAPGNLISEKILNDRAIYQYKTLQPIKFSFGITSANYIPEEFEFGDKKVVVYSLHKGIEKSFVDGVRDAIRFSEERFTEYPYDEIRVIEFPLSEGSFATVYGNNLVLSELRFLASPDLQPEKIDIAYYVAAHETMHFWWGNEVIPAHAQGATMITESITEYQMLRLLAESQSQEASKEFYGLQKERYKNGKLNLTIEEPNLARVQPSQQFISYGKGAFSLFDLSEEIGQDAFDSFLNDFLWDWKGRDIYPTSDDFVNSLKAFTKHELDELIDQIFYEVD